METKHRDNIRKAKLVTFKTSLNNIVFNTKNWESRNTQDKEPQEISRNEPNPEPRQPTSKDKLRSKVRASETILEMMITPSREVCSAPVTTQIATHLGYIAKMRELAYGVAMDLVNIGPGNRDHINDVELGGLNTSMIDIGHKASTHYKDLRIWKDSITTLQSAMEAIQ